MKRSAITARCSINVTDESKGVFKTVFLLAWPVFLAEIIVRTEKVWMRCRSDARKTVIRD